MKKVLIIALSLVIFLGCKQSNGNISTSINAENYKTIDLNSIANDAADDSAKIASLKKVGIIWGFLKYYHPAVAKGKYNWDQELIKITSIVMAEDNVARQDSILCEWIGGLGKISQKKRADNINTDNIKLYPDLEWINNSSFSPELVEKLNCVKNAKRKKRNHYVELNLFTSNPIFKNEESYKDLTTINADYRLISLFRYWNIIQYYFPYINLIEERWEDVLTEFIPRFLKAESKQKYLITTLELIGRVKDTHANINSYHELIHHYFGRFFANPKITFIEDMAVVTGFYSNEEDTHTDLKVGDVIMEVNGEKVEDIISRKLPYTPASNYPTQLRDIARDLLRTDNETLTVKYISDGTTEKITTLNTYDPFHIGIFARENKASFSILEDNISYLYPGSLKKGEINELWDKIKTTKGLIIDLRCYPSDFIVFSLGIHLMPKSTPFVKFTNTSIKNAGLFEYRDNLWVGRNNPDYYKGKVVILINEQTQSQAEYTTMALRVAPNATVIGSTTAGADGNVSEIILPGGIKTWISGIGVYYPNGDETQRVGIIPDIELRPTIQGIKDGKDELLDRAINVILSEQTTVTEQAD